jgi:hypothetical protein
MRVVDFKVLSHSDIPQIYDASVHILENIIDSESDIRRNSTVTDVEHFALISDKLENIDVVGVPVMPQDVTPKATFL